MKLHLCHSWLGLGGPGLLRYKEEWITNRLIANRECTAIECIKKNTKRNSAFFVLIVEALAIALGVYFVGRRDWTSAIWSLSTAVAIPLWIAGFKVRTRCRVITAKGRRCPNPTTGVVFGCSQANHTWAKLLARFGLDRRPTVMHAEDSEPRSTATASPAGVFDESAPPIRVQVENGRKDTVLFWFATCATVSGFVSATVDVTGLLAK